MQKIGFHMRVGHLTKLGIDNRRIEVTFVHVGLDEATPYLKELCVKHPNQALLV